MSFSLSSVSDKGSADIEIGQRHALLIGNDNYEGDLLRVCRNDANDLGRKMREMGFSARIKYDLGHEGIKTNLNTFVNSIDEGDFVFFFFSGHGYHQHGNNYIVPVLRHGENDNKSLGFSLRQIISPIMKKKPAVAVFLFDCCHNDYAVDLKGPEFDEPGLLICFACGASRSAITASKDFKHSLFTSHLIKYITKAHLTVSEVLANVIDSIRRDVPILRFLKYPIFKSTLKDSHIYFHHKWKEYIKLNPTSINDTPITKEVIPQRASELTRDKTMINTSLPLNFCCTRASGNLNSITSRPTTTIPRKNRYFQSSAIRTSSSNRFRHNTMEEMHTRPQTSKQPGQRSFESFSDTWIHLGSIPSSTLTHLPANPALSTTLNSCSHPPPPPSTPLQGSITFQFPRPPPSALVINRPRTSQPHSSVPPTRYPLPSYNSIGSTTSHNYPLVAHGNPSMAPTIFYSINSSAHHSPLCNYWPPPPYYSHKNKRE